MRLQEALILRGAPYDKSCVQGAKAAKCFVITLGVATFMHIPHWGVKGIKSINSWLSRPGCRKLKKSESDRFCSKEQIGCKKNIVSKHPQSDFVIVPQHDYINLKYHLNYRSSLRLVLPALSLPPLLAP